MVLKHSLALFFSLAVFFSLQGCGSTTEGGEIRILHVSYDVSREVFAAVNEVFTQEFEKSRPGVKLQLENTHAGSTRQAQALADGLEAQFVSMNNIFDMDFLARQSGSKPGTPLIPQDWKQRFPRGASPWYTVGALVVRKGNPRNLRNWEDLTTPGLKVVVPHFRTSGTGRHAYQSLWGEILSRGGDAVLAQNALKALVQNVPVFATGGRNATHIFTEQGQGDVLLTVEAEARTLLREFGEDRFEVVIPAFSLEAPVYVSAVDPGQQDDLVSSAVEEYGRFLFSDTAQKLAEKHYFRPGLSDRARTPGVRSVESVLGDPQAFFLEHFSSGGIADRLLEEKGK